jgi:hypothetical protein
MLKAAARKGYIKTNPAAECARMMGGGRTRGILTTVEARTLFDETDIKKLWNNNLSLYTINLLGASTGLRCGEAQVWVPEIMAYVFQKLWQYPFVSPTSCQGGCQFVRPLRIGGIRYSTWVTHSALWAGF